MIQALYFNTDAGKAQSRASWFSQASGEFYNSCNLKNIMWSNSLNKKKKPLSLRVNSWCLKTSRPRPIQLVVLTCAPVELLPAWSEGSSSAKWGQTLSGLRSQDTEMAIWGRILRHLQLTFLGVGGFHLVLPFWVLSENPVNTFPLQLGEYRRAFSSRASFQVQHIRVAHTNHFVPITVPILPRIENEAEITFTLSLKKQCWIFLFFRLRDHH